VLVFFNAEWRERWKLGPRSCQNLYPPRGSVRWRTLTVTAVDGTEAGGELVVPIGSLRLWLIHGNGSFLQVVAIV